MHANFRSIRMYRRGENSSEKSLCTHRPPVVFPENASSVARDRERRENFVPRAALKRPPEVSAGESGTHARGTSPPGFAHHPCLDLALGVSDGERSKLSAVGASLVGASCISESTRRISTSFGKRTTYILGVFFA